MIQGPLSDSESFFDDALIDRVVGCTKLYSHREKADSSFEITSEKFLGMLLLNVLGDAPDTFVQAMFDSVSRDIMEVSKRYV